MIRAAKYSAAYHDFKYYNILILLLLKQNVICD